MATIVVFCLLVWVGHKILLNLFSSFLLKAVLKGESFKDKDEQLAMQATYIHTMFWAAFWVVIFVLLLGRL